MWSSPTALTSTTPSSSSWRSRPETAPDPHPVPVTSPSPALAVIACGALGGHVRDIAARRGWPVELHCLPSLLHNHPGRIAPAVERLAIELQARGLRVALGYADCGSYGALDQLCLRLRLGRPPRPPRSDLPAGPGQPP